MKQKLLKKDYGHMVCIGATVRAPSVDTMKHWLKVQHSVQVAPEVTVQELIDLDESFRPTEKFGYRFPGTSQLRPLVYDKVLFDCRTLGMGNEIANFEYWIASLVIEGMKRHQLDICVSEI